MINFPQLKQGMEVVTDGMLINETKKNSINFKKISLI